MDKNSFSITYEAGAIEDPIIKNRVIDVLEGTMPAFDLRRKSMRIRYLGRDLSGQF